MSSLFEYMDCCFIFKEIETSLSVVLEDASKLFLNRLYINDDSFELFSLIVPSTWYHLYDYGLEDIPLWNTDTAY